MINLNENCIVPGIEISFSMTLANVELVNINPKSCTISLKLETVFITRANFNKLLRGQTLNYKIVEREYEGVMFKWVAVSKFSIF